MVNKECNLRAGVNKVQTFGTTHSPISAQISFNLAILAEGNNIFFSVLDA
jgi:hypothetical protein